MEEFGNCKTATILDDQWSKTHTHSYQRQVRRHIKNSFHSSATKSSQV